MATANNNETVREVCAEMYKGVKDWRGERVGVFDNFADRILTAYGREMAAKDAEITRLKAALKPVMECTTGYVHVPEMGLCKVDLYEAQRASFKAVQNAQGIMRHAEI